MGVISQETVLEKVPDVTPEDAVADAMLVAQNYLLKVFAGEKEQENEDWEALSIEEIVEQATARMCDRASATALLFLGERYDDMFKKLFLVSARNSADYIQLFDGKDWDYHVYAIAESVDGTYYAFSPANHDPNSKASSLVRVLKADTLGDVLSKIQKVDGGVWPCEDYITTLPENLLKINYARGRENLAWAEMTMVSMSSALDAEPTYKVYSPLHF